MLRSDQINELAAALAKAQAKIKVAPKDNVAQVESKRTGAKFTYRYSTLADVWEACRAPLAECGLAVMQTVATEGATAKITTMLAHSSGQWVAGELALTAAEPSPQAIGSAITYGRRYGLSAMVGVVSDEDDDGAEATHGKQKNGNGKVAPAAHPTLSTEDVARIQAANFEDFKSRLLAAKTKEDREKVYPEIRESHDKGAISDAQRKLLLAVANAAASGVAA